MPSFVFYRTLLGGGGQTTRESQVIFKVNREKMILNSCLIKNGTVQEGGDSLLS